MTRWAAWLLFAILVAAPAAAQQQRAFFEMSLNGVEHGDVLVVIRGEDVLVAVSTLTDAGLRVDGVHRETVDAADFISLASLAPGVTFRIDDAALRLLITADPDLLATSVRSLDDGVPADLRYSSAPSAFVNYAASAGTNSGYELLAEAGVSARGALVYTTATRNARSTVRGLTNFTIDRRGWLQRWVVGDNFVSAGPLGGDALLAGVTVGREFSLAPYFVRFPTMSMSTPVSMPSVLEVHVNGRLVREEQVQPGRIDVTNLPLSTGHNETRLVVRDPFGATREITSGFYVTSAALARGIHEYQYSAGWRRGSLGTSSWDYREPVALTRHRLGFTNSVTGGFRFEAARGLMSAGPSVNLRLPAGEIEVAAGVSRSGSTWGNAGHLSYLYVGRRISFGTLATRTDSRYATVSLRLDQPRPETSWNAFASVPVGGSTVTVQHTRATGSDNVAQQRTSASGSARLTGSAEIVGSVSRVRSVTAGGTEATVGLTVTLGPRTVASASMVQTPASRQLVADIQRPVPMNTGFGYQFRAETLDRTTASGMAQYQGQYGRYEVRRDMIGSSPQTGVSISGGIVAIGGGLYPSRPVRGSYALVRVPGVSGVRAMASNQEVGRTGRRGSLLIPDLLPYYGNKLAIADSDIPLDFSVPEVEMTLAPPYRGGAVALFPVRRVQRATGRVLLVTADRGEQVPAYGSIELPGPEAALSSPLGGDGEFYFENVSPGRHTAVVTSAQGTCELVLEIPTVEGPLVSLGVVRCQAVER